MSANEAAERLRLHFKSHDGPCQYCRAVASVDIRDALAHERNAEATPLDVELLAMAIYGDRWYETEMYRGAAKIAAEYARLSEGTNPHPRESMITIWDRALTTEEIADLYASGWPEPADPGEGTDR